MSYQNAELLRDRNGSPIPQFFDVQANRFEPITKDSYQETQKVNIIDGPDDYPDAAVRSELELVKQVQSDILTRLNEPLPMQVTGSTTEIDVNVVNSQSVTLQEQKTESDITSNKVVFNKPLRRVDIYNKGEEGVFNINNLDITIPADTFFAAEVGGTPSAEITVTGATSFIIGRYE